MSQEHFATFIRREARQQRISATELARQVIFKGTSKNLKFEKPASIKSIT